MARGRLLAALFAASLLVNAFCVPAKPRGRRQEGEEDDNEIDPVNDDASLAQEFVPTEGSPDYGEPSGPPPSGLAKIFGAPPQEGGPPTNGIAGPFPPNGGLNYEGAGPTPATDEDDEDLENSFSPTNEPTKIPFPVSTEEPVPIDEIRGPYEGRQQSPQQLQQSPDLQQQSPQFPQQPPQLAQQPQEFPQQPPQLPQQPQQPPQFPQQPPQFPQQPPQFPQQPPQFPQQPPQIPQQPQQFPQQPQQFPQQPPQFPQQPPQFPQEPLQNRLSTSEDEDDDSDEDEEPMEGSPSRAGTGGGSNIFSILNLATNLFPGSSGSNVLIRNMIRDFLVRNQALFFQRPPRNRRQDFLNNEINVDFAIDLKPPPVFPKEVIFQKQETEESGSDSNSSDSAPDSSENNETVEDNAAEEQDNNNADSNESKNESKQDSESNNNSDYDSDEGPGGGDGEGGGILGLLAGLSGGEDGQSDLGTLLGAVSGIIANLSGDGFDLNSIIASSIGLFVGLLSQGEENPGTVIAEYLLTALDSLTGGGSKNNGAFFGSFLSKLVKGTSAFVDPEASSEENANQMNDSAGFFASFLMSLLGEMSKGSFDLSKGSSNSGGWR